MRRQVDKLAEEELLDDSGFVQLQRRGAEYRSLSHMRGGYAAVQNAMQGPPRSEAYERGIQGSLIAL